MKRKLMNIKKKYREFNKKIEDLKEYDKKNS